ncbi:PTS glucose transporter subunit IIA [Atopobacter sp. AH10]|uniref:PTS sugar transporter subunit IIA n=1 Tax=Atopobacter sp. AH10 TaxID=2315861 RepID=UPI000EF28ACD|nr:PTS glucose transporter subunit IIA [Atopobacter sp. AH10]RLK64103.1 PTS glucose transporter subunit IIA [Atopobacter sp. AH10]
MFEFLKRVVKVTEKKGPVELFAPVNGYVIPIGKVSDPVFAEKLIGDGYGVKPTDGKVYAPVSGTISSVFQTKQTLGIRTPEGLEVMVHMGVNTAELKGSPFENHVQEGDKVTPETLLSTMDLRALKEAKKDNVVIVVITSMNRVKDYTISHQGDSTAKEKIGKIELAR